MERHLDKEESCAICLTPVAEIIQPVLGNDMFIYCDICIRTWLRNHDTSPRTRRLITKILLPCAMTKNENGITATVDWNHPIDTEEKATRHTLESTINQLIQSGTPLINSESIAQSMEILSHMIPDISRVDISNFDISNATTEMFRPENIAQGISIIRNLIENSEMQNPIMRDILNTLSNPEGVEGLLNFLRQEGAGFMNFNQF